MHDNLYEYVRRELDELDQKSKSGLSMSEMQYADLLEHFKKSYLAVEAMEGGYSGDERSYDRGRGTYAKRDSMGRYSSRYSREGSSRRGYSRGGDMLEELRGLMEDAPDERTKSEFQRFISKIESM